MQEEIGTGGGGFRFIYGHFYNRQYAYHPDDKSLILPNNLLKAGDLWRTAAVQASAFIKVALGKQEDYNRMGNYPLEVADLEKQAFQALSHKMVSMSIPAVRIQDLSFGYPGSPVTLHTSKSGNTWYAVWPVWPNGAGKLRQGALMTGVLPCAAGEIWLPEYSIKEQQKSINKLFGLVPQDFPLPGIKPGRKPGILVPGWFT